MSLSSVRVSLAGVLTLLGSCLTPPEVVADRVFRGGAVLASARASETERGLALLGSQVVALAPDARLLRFIGTQTECVDLRGYLVLPLALDYGAADFWSDVEASAALSLEREFGSPPWEAEAERTAVERELRLRVERAGAELAAGESANFVVAAPSPLALRLADVSTVRIVNVFRDGEPARGVARVPQLRKAQVESADMLPDVDAEAEQR